MIALFFRYDKFDWILLSDGPHSILLLEHKSYDLWIILYYLDAYKLFLSYLYLSHFRK